MRSSSKVDDPGSAGPEIQVRAATPADIDALMLLYFAFMEHEGQAPPPSEELRRRLERLLTCDTDEVLIAFTTAGRAAGYLQQRYFYSVWRPGCDAFIEDIFVIEPLRGRRIGASLLEHAFEQARARGVGRICLDTNEHNTRGRRLYERLGFRNEAPQWANGRQMFYSRLL